MINVHVKKFNTVVMDGTHEQTVNFVKDIIEDLNTAEASDGTIANYGKATCRPLDDKHPSMIVIEVRTTEERYGLMRYLIDLALPGRCIFNPPM